MHVSLTAHRGIREVIVNSSMWARCSVASKQNMGQFFFAKPELQPRGLALHRRTLPHAWSPVVAAYSYSSLRRFALRASPTPGDALHLGSQKASPIPSIPSQHLKQAGYTKNALLCFPTPPSPPQSFRCTRTTRLPLAQTLSFI